MKIGALDYLIKPFEPDKMIPMILGIYEDFEAAKGLQKEVGAIVLCGGTDYYDPKTGKNTYGYGVYPNVLTSIEFERMLSGSGPQHGRLYRPFDGKPVKKIGWVQCVGSRDLQTDADFCSNICCMYAIKEALLAKEKSPEDIETTIFYMDMRTFEKPFQRYRETAENENGVRFIRGRIHSITQNKEGDLFIRYADQTGTIQEVELDLMVLSIGQRPAGSAADLSKIADLEMNPWGFIQTEDFSLCRTKQEGIIVGGAYSGLKDISNSVIQASAAALLASRVLHTSGGGIMPEVSETESAVDVSRERPRILTLICTCGETILNDDNIEELARKLKKDPSVQWVEFLGQTCTETGWKELVERVKDYHPNRVLIGACFPYVYAQKLGELGELTGLSPSLMDVVDIRKPLFYYKDGDRNDREDIILGALEIGIAKLKHMNPFPVATIPVQQQALVVGGGIAGMAAALAIADHGFHVDLVEKGDNLGGNLKWLKHTIEGLSMSSLLEEHITKVEKHGLIDVHVASKVVSSFGEVGTFMTTFENAEGTIKTTEHGVTILATGGGEAPASSYGYGSHEFVVTQKELALALDEKQIDPANLNSIVMIQCVGSREEPRNYCSRICCASSLKHALEIKKINPDANIYILYRDMMAFGFLESYYTQARKAGIIFIQYDPTEKPEARFEGDFAYISTIDPILGKRVEIEADMLVLATGIIPDLPADLAETFGATLDSDGFFQEAEFKWRPVDALKEGVFACGLAHSPRSVLETIATAEAAAQRALRILHHKKLPAGKVVATVRHALCSLCERCIETCPYGARTLDVTLGKVMVNPAMCQGCGDCATVCPNSASVVYGFVDQQIFDMIDSVFQNAG
jgi:heterodisulfide reductase subunit A